MLDIDDGPETGVVVPVAKLSRRFYETFGDEIANELAEWFNLMDVTYRTELRELIDLNYQRFDAKLEQRISELRTEFRVALAQQKTDLIRWMFGFWIGNIATTATIVLAVAKFMR